MSQAAAGKTTWMGELLRAKQTENTQTNSTKAAQVRHYILMSKTQRLGMPMKPCCSIQPFPNSSTFLGIVSVSLWFFSCRSLKKREKAEKGGGRKRRKGTASLVPLWSTSTGILLSCSHPSPTQQCAFKCNTLSSCPNMRKLSVFFVPKQALRHNICYFLSVHFG